MKKLLLIIVILSFVLPGYSQYVTVRDKTTLQPLYMVNIYTSKMDQTIITDIKGKADISAFRNADSIFFQYTGYAKPIYSYSQLEKMGFEVLLSEKIEALDAVVVSASKFEEKMSDVPQKIDVLTAKDIAYINQPTTAEVLQQTGQVLVQKSQMGGGSPIIRGFEANKVLLVVDGVRLNNAIYRGGHLQNSITIDNSMLNRLEIVFGPGSVVYGSDALGGVVHFHTKNPLLAGSGSKTFTRGTAFTRYSSAFNEKTGHVDFNIGMKKVAFLTSITFTDFGDLVQGSDRSPFLPDFGKRVFYQGRINGTDTMLMNSNVNVQKASGYSQYDILEKILFKQNENVTHILNLQYSNTTDVPRYDRLAEMSGNQLRYGEWYYGPQARVMAAYTLSLDKTTKFYKNARFIAAYQDISESRHSRSFGKNTRSNRFENVKVYTINFDFDKLIGRHELRYGAEATYNDVTSTAFAENIVTGEQSNLDTRYPAEGSSMRTLAGYLTHTWEISERFILSDGIRYSSIAMNADFGEQTVLPFREVNQNSSAVNGNLGLIYMPGNDWRFSALASSGFRAPNVDDLGKVFESVPGNVIVPNPDLEPEYIYNAEAGISKSFNKNVTLEGTGYYSWYINAITTQPFLFNGQDSIIYDGRLSLVTANVNAGEAYIYGFNGNLKADITQSFSLYSSITYTYGRIMTDSVDLPLDHIPPLYGKTGINLNIRKFRGEFFALYNGWKKVENYNIFGEDNFAQATPYGMPAWFTLNLRTAYQLNSYLNIQVNVENLLDRNYRVFASGISAPGRNFVIALRANF